MTSTASETRPRPRRTTDDSIHACLSLLEGMLDRAPDHMFDTRYFEEVRRELRRLHARVRIHHAADCVQGAEGPDKGMAPDLQEELKRLWAEHPNILGALDRLIRSMDAMADRTLEDKDVFLLRGRELIAVLRRHEAEEDRVFYLSVWRDTGGVNGT